MGDKRLGKGPFRCLNLPFGLGYAWSSRLETGTTVYGSGGFLASTMREVTRAVRLAMTLMLLEFVLVVAASTLLPFIWPTIAFLANVVLLVFVGFALVGAFAMGRLIRNGISVDTYTVCEGGRFLATLECTESKRVPWGTT